MDLSTLDKRICNFLRSFPHQKKYRARYEDEAHRDFLRALFEFLCNSDEGYLPLFFPDGVPPLDEPWSLSKAQGAVEGAEYTEAARGKPCGHILKSGEPSYRCRTCTADETAVLCSRCFDASDHEGHQVTCSVSSGSAGCCDCGDAEAWIRAVHCRIHSELPGDAKGKSAAKGGEAQPPPELLESIRITIARMLDYFNDVMSCAPEQLRLPKTETSVRENERSSRLNTPQYSDGVPEEEDTEYGVVVWNDEKHNSPEVQNHIAQRAKMAKSQAGQLAYIIATKGRCAVKYGTDVAILTDMARHMNNVKIATTIRSARDIFREQMCAAIIEWLADIAGCTVGSDARVLRETICDEMLQPWRRGSEAPHMAVGQDGLFDWEAETRLHEEERIFGRRQELLRAMAAQIQGRMAQSEEDAADEDGVDTAEVDDGEEEVDTMQIEPVGEASVFPDQDVNENDALETNEATLAGYSPPPPPPAPRPGFSSIFSTNLPMEVPDTPALQPQLAASRPPDYWLQKPEGFARVENLPAREDLWQRTRIDWMILFDLRMWKNIRCITRDLFISTVVNIPQFKRLISLRFAGLYTPLAQLYLIADREPDYSIISLSLQMLTTPSITAEIIDRGNFLTALLAILYTFMTTRQVSYPESVNLNATLAFEAGIAVNRRLSQFWHDMKCLLGSPLALTRIRNEDRYMLQFLDLVKLHQGIVPNKRALNEHVEFESEDWINASMVTKEISRLSRHISEAFVWNTTDNEDNASVRRAIRQAAFAATINSIGAERHRFRGGEIREATVFKELEAFEFERNQLTSTASYRATLGPLRIVDFVVERGRMSFHHPLHYTVSWLVECGRSMTAEELRQLLLFDFASLQAGPLPKGADIPNLDPDDYLMAMFEFPLRQLAWLPQIRFGLWVRNGHSMRHQSISYRGVINRDITYLRDIFMLQTALVTLNPRTVFAAMLDRFELASWARGDFSDHEVIDESQRVEIAEDLIHLLIVILCDRQGLRPAEERQEAEVAILRQEIAHVLCFKPLSYSSLTSGLTERIRDADNFDHQLADLATYRAPRFLDDTGMFELREEFTPLIDPYNVPYTRNQRDEAETIYRKYRAKITGQKFDDIVFEPQLLQLSSGAFKDLAAFTRLPIFAQAIYYFLKYTLNQASEGKQTSSTKTDTLLQSTLHLTLIAVLEDRSTDDGPMEELSFVKTAIGGGDDAGHQSPSLIPFLQAALANQSSAAKAKRILQLMREKRPKYFSMYPNVSDLGLDRGEDAPGGDDQQQLKRLQAKERAARILAQFKDQQKSFISQQDIDWGVDDDGSSSGENIHTPIEEDQEAQDQQYPTGECIHCKEPCGDGRLHGIFTLFKESKLLRQTPQHDADWTAEIFDVPTSLDRSAETIRPFGVAGKNIRRVERTAPDGTSRVAEYRVLGKGFPRDSTVTGPVATGCGWHLMHYSCFEEYVRATQRRHQAQTTRHHPEDLKQKEFLCPFCKALGNAFLPIAWKSRSITVQKDVGCDRDTSFETWLVEGLQDTVGRLRKAEADGRLASPDEVEEALLQRQESLYQQHASSTFVPSLAKCIGEFAQSTFPVVPSQPYPDFHRLPAYVPTTRAPESVAPIVELFRSYQSLRDSFEKNQLKTRFDYNLDPSSNSDELTHTDTLARALAFSIASTEIAQRGVENDRVLLEGINSSALLHLSVLAQTAVSYISVGGLRNNGQTKTNHEFVKNQVQQLRQLFIGLPAISGVDQAIFTLEFKILSPFLSADPFTFLTEASVYLIPAFKLVPRHVLLLCYVSEVVRVIFSCCSIDESRTGNRSCLSMDPTPQTTANTQWPAEADGQSEDSSNFKRLVIELLALYQDASKAPAGPVQQTLSTLPDDHPFFRQMRAAVATYSLPFLRKAIILMNVRFGVDYTNSLGLIDRDRPELERLTDLLRLPTLPKLVELILLDTRHSQALRSVIRGWVRHWVWTQEGQYLDMAVSPGKAPVPQFSFSLSHPGIFELVGLPTKYATMADAAVALRCPRTGLELTDATLCLLCGEIYCGQSVCNDEDQTSAAPSKIGGSQKHRLKCGGTVGMSLSIRKGFIHFLHCMSGSWFQTPYLDQHGEADPSLRRHEQLFLSMRRADMTLRKIWLEGQIPSAIARRLDSENNQGGWDTV